LPANGSWHDGEYFAHFWDVFAVFKSIGKDAKRECFGALKSLLLGGAVSVYARQIDDVGDPASVVFTLNFNA
jgi:hypothetical protein